MRKLGPEQIGMLEAMNLYASKGVTKSDFLGRQWRVIDRLTYLGLCDQRSVFMQGPTYFINEAGRAALAAGTYQQLTSETEP